MAIDLTPSCFITCFSVKGLHGNCQTGHHIKQIRMTRILQPPCTIVRKCQGSGVMVKCLILHLCSFNKMSEESYLLTF